MRRCVLTILFFPVIAPLFFLGWALYVVGDRKTSNKTVLKRKLSFGGQEDESTANEQEVEAGFVGEVAEELLTD